MNNAYELAGILLVAYTLPALLWIVTLFSPKSSSKHIFAAFYFFTHILVELYCFIVPIVYLHGYWNDT